MQHSIFGITNCTFIFPVVIIIVVLQYREHIIMTIGSIKYVQEAMRTVFFFSNCCNNYCAPE
jgi:hypothetical protein